MTITFTKAYVANGKTYATLEEAQIQAIEALFGVETDKRVWNKSDVATTILSNKEAVIDILTTTTTSKPSARKINGGTKKRKPKTPEQPQLPNTEAA